MTESDVEAAFAQHLASTWTGTFPHSFDMPARKGSAVYWHEWREEIRKNRGRWICENLRDAAEQYCWDFVAKRQGRKVSIECRTLLRAALASEDDEAAEAACTEIFRWGGVGRSSRHWVEALAASGNLCITIKRALAVLTSSIDESDAFDGVTLLMNSAMAKVYSFADEQTSPLPIYDGRVGAALGYLVVDYCRAAKLRNVPQCLRFRYHHGKTKSVNRNPSREAYAFSTLGNHRYHARNAWQAHRILGSASRLAQCSVIDLERALFMIGYDLPTPL